MIAWATIELPREGIVTNGIAGLKNAMSFLPVA